MSTSTVHFSPLKSCKITPDVALATVKNVYLDTLRCIPEEGLGLKMMAHNQQFAVAIRIREC